MPTALAPARLALRLFYVALVASLAACSEPTSPFAFLDQPSQDADVQREDAGAPTDALAEDGSNDSAPSDAGDEDRDAAAPPDATTDTPSAQDAVVYPEGLYVDEVPDTAIAVGIGTLNLARFFDTTCDSERCADGDFEYQPTQAEFDYRVFQIQQGIEMLEVDVVLVQEVETAASLEALRRALGDEWVTAEIGETGFAASLDVGVLARFPATRTTGYRDRIEVQRPDGSTTTFAREFLEVTLDVQGRELIVFTSHFKSKNNDDPGRRFGEAAAARDIVLARAIASPNAVLVLGGDLNDTPGSGPLNELERLGGLERTTQIIDGRDGTIVFRGEAQAIDHLYLATDAAGSVLRDSVRVVRDASNNLGGGDHAGLRATVVLP
jgi:endonuclease/exonuclease/phosphatase family metal-dependent hydrolase